MMRFPQVFRNPHHKASSINVDRQDLGDIYITVDYRLWKLEESVGLWRNYRTIN